LVDGRSEISALGEAIQRVEKGKSRERWALWEKGGTANGILST
jgi:hypothetical protein